MTQAVVFGRHVGDSGRLATERQQPLEPQGPIGPQRWYIKRDPFAASMRFHGPFSLGTGIGGRASRTEVADIGPEATLFSLLGRREDL